MEPTAQSYREILLRQGWIPLIIIGNEEHWVRGGRRCILTWVGTNPDKVPLESTRYVYFSEVCAQVCSESDVSQVKFIVAEAE